MSNPFESPRAPAGATASPSAEYHGPWRDGDKVIAASGRRWPARCVKCNIERDVVPVRVGSRSAEGIEWLVLFLLGPIAWVFWWFRVRGTGTVVVYVCPDDRWWAVWRRAAIILGSVATAIGGMRLAATFDDMRFLVIPLAALGTGFLWKVSLVRIRRADGRRLEMGSVDPSFRAGLPPLTEAIDLDLRASGDLLEEL